MTYRHASGEADGFCYACLVDDADWHRLTDEPSTALAHDADKAMEDEGGPICWCGHYIEEVPEPITA